MSCKSYNSVATHHTFKGFTMLGLLLALLSTKASLELMDEIEEVFEPKPRY